MKRYFWNPLNLWPFRFFSFFLCFLSACSWYISGMYLELKPNKYSGSGGGGVKSGGKSEQVDVEMMRRVSSSGSSRKGVDELDDDLDERNMLLDAGGGSGSGSGGGGGGDGDGDGSLTSISTTSTSTREEFVKWWKFVKELLAQRPFKSYVGECFRFASSFFIFFDIDFDF